MNLKIRSLKVQAKPKTYREPTNKVEKAHKLPSYFKFLLFFTLHTLWREFRVLH